MTPKEKALELIERFKEYDYDWRALGNDFCIKQYALITVDEILLALNIPSWNGNPDDSPQNLGDGLYWSEVRCEINNLFKHDTTNLC